MEIPCIKNYDIDTVVKELHRTLHIHCVLSGCRPLTIPLADPIPSMQIHEPNILSATPDIKKRATDANEGKLQNI